MVPLLLGVCLAVAMLLWPGRGERTRVSEFEPGGAGAGGGGERDPSGPDVADLLDLLALALRGGAGISESLLLVGNAGTGERGARLRSVGAALRWGLAPEAAWADAGPEWAPAAAALRLAAVAGVPPADVLVRAASDLRRDHRARLAEETARVGVRLVLPLGLTFLPAFVLASVVPIVLALAGSVLGS